MQILPGGEKTFLLLFGLLLGAFAVRSALRLWAVLRLLRHGERVEGWCADRRVRDRGSVRGNKYAEEYVFAFRTREGREVEFVDHTPGPFGYEIGAPIAVTYDPSAPEKRATVAGRGAWGPLIMPAVFTGGLGFFSVLLLFGFAALSGFF